MSDVDQRAFTIDPDEMDLQLVYADAVAGDLGESIVIAVELSRAGIATLDDLVFGDLEGEELVRRTTQLRRLRELDTTARGGRPFGSAVVEPGGLPHLAALLETEPLTSIACSRITAAELRELGEMRLDRVRALSFDRCYSDRFEFGRIADVTPRLASLAFTDPHRTDIRYFGAHPGLRELAIAEPSTDAHDALMLAAFSARLTTLVLGHRHRPDTREWWRRPTDAFIATHRCLERLELRCLSLRDEDFSSFLGRTYPELAITGDPIGPAAIDELAGHLGNVKRLDLRGAQLDDDTLAVIANSAPRLEHLAVSGTAITDRGLDALSPLQLRRVRLEGTSVTAPGIARLANAHALEAVAVDTEIDVWPVLPSTTSARTLRSVEAAVATEVSGLPALRRVRARRSSHVDALRDLGLVDLSLEDAR